jgi:hypothetical protein
MRGNELPEPAGKVQARGGNDVPLGAAGVRDHRLRPQAGGDAGHDFRGRADRRGDQHQIGVRHLLPDIETGAVENAEFKRLRQRTQATPETDDLADLSGSLECQSEGAPDQADAENDDLAEQRVSLTPGTRRNGS